MAERVPSKKEYREVLVSPLAAGREALALLVVIGLIILLMGIRFSLIAPKNSKESPKTYQLSDLNLKNQAPTLYRALLGGVGDILYLREEKGSWPDVDLLQEEGLPPFAGNMLPAGLRGFVWELHESAGWVDYYGINTEIAKGQGGDPLQNSFILRIINLKNGEYQYPYCRQEKNPATNYSSQIWMNPQKTDYPAGALVKRGWKWIMSAESSQSCVVIDQSEK